MMMRVGKVGEVVIPPRRYYIPSMYDTARRAF